MTETPKPKGLSKGCLIGIIVALVLIVIVVGGIIYIWKNQDDLVKYSIANVVNESKTQLAAVPEPYLDTVIFNHVADEFLAKLEKDTLNLQAGKGASMVLVIQEMGMSPKFDSTTITSLFHGMIEMYPELNEYVEGAIGSMEMDASDMIDSMNVDSMMNEASGN